MHSVRVPHSAQVRWSEKYDTLERRYAAAQEHIVTLESEVESIAKTTSSAPPLTLAPHLCLTLHSACHGGGRAGARP